MFGRRSKQLAIYPRSLRRVTTLLLLAVTIIFAGYVRSILFNDWHTTTNITFETFIEPIPFPLKQAVADLLPSSYPLKLGSHTFRDDGLLLVNPRGRHPIFDLIEHSRKQWNEKHERSSKTLSQAAEEYKRRYKRLPPRGFDHWWAYVQEHNVQLPDEYDQIFRDIEPFFAVEPSFLRKTQQEWEGHADSFTLGKDQDLLHGGFAVIDLLKDVEQHIPAFHAVFHPHDNPVLLRDIILEKKALRTASKGTYLDLPIPHDQVKLNGWIAACDSSSPAWSTKIDWDNPPLKSVPPHTKTFIHALRPASDPCLHPSHLQSHGQFLSHRKGPIPERNLVPFFSYGPSSLHYDIVTAVPHSWVDDIKREDDPDWDAKYDHRVQWRGRNTGIWHDDGSLWRAAHRVRMMEWATKNMHQNLTILDWTRDVSEEVGLPRADAMKARFAPAMLDIAFAYEPSNCRDDTCKQLKQMFEYRNPHNYKEAGRYKYILDVDGNGWSSRFKRLITSNSLIFKSSIYVEWFTDRIQPWVHFIPVQVDYSDFWDSLTFFRGDPNGDGAHDDLARRIALEGREWSLNYWRKEDMTAYMFRLFLEYARVMSTDREAMAYKHPTS